jgi:hypothetical protein
LGSIYQVVNVIFSESKYVLPNAKYVALPNQVALTIKNELNQGKLVLIEKEFIDNPKSKDIPLKNFKIKTPKTIDQKKSAEKSKVHKRISSYTALLTAYDIFEYMVVSAKLISMGYDILNDEKRDDVYLSIVETENEELINDLERFLEIKDVFDSIMKKYRGLKQYFKELDGCENEEELKDVIESNKGWLIN